MPVPMCTHTGLYSSHGVAMATWGALSSAESGVGEWLCTLTVHFPSETVIRSKTDQSVCLCLSSKHAVHLAFIIF